MPSTLASLLQMRGENKENLPDLMAEASGQKRKGLSHLCRLLLDLVMIKNLYTYWIDDEVDEDE